ncbi:MAG: hypothetical protein QG650_108 [Patescibacteria group bacterium]|nr:hypothetical protein [Patescibacteria group bacterium]
MDHQRYVKRFLSSVRLGTFVSVAFFIGFVVVSVAFADDALPTSGIGGLPFASKSPTGSITALIKQVVLYTGIFAVVSLTWGGFLFITAFGEDEKVKKGKNIVKFSLIGVLLSISAYAIVDVVNRLAV